MLDYVMQNIKLDKGEFMDIEELSHGTGCITLARMKETLPIHCWLDFGKLGKRVTLTKSNTLLSQMPELPELIMNKRIKM